MSLQNKKTHLLDTTNDTGDDEALDLFDKYGGGGDEDFDVSPANPPTQSTSSTAQNISNSSSSVHSDVASAVNNEEISDEYNDNTDSSVESELETVVSEPKSVTGTGESTKEWESKIEGGIEEVTTAPKDIFDKFDDANAEQTPVEEEVKKPESTPSPKAVPPVKKNFNTVVDKVDKEKEKAKQVFVEQKQESVYEASATNRGVKSKKEQEIKKSYTGKKDKLPKREVHIDPSKKTILIVDDDIDTLEMYADVFESANYNVLRASDGLEAMALVAKHTPHVVFTGIVMPRMDGFALMDALKQNKRTADIPVVINSHLGRETDKEKAKELGARDFIVRGFTQPREVVERIGAMLLRSEYVFRFDKNDPEARKLAKDLGAPNFYHCPRGQEMVLKLRITDEKDLTFAARFSCMDAPEK